MKKISAFASVFAILIISYSLNAQNTSATDSTGVPGDNFSLHGAIEMFKKTGSPEEFEKFINSKENNVNNLDLNGDGDIDYIRVIDKSGKDVHAFVLQVPVSEKENQDIAVIELEKTGDASAILQIIGDEDIYGEEVIVEPGSPEDDNKGDNGPYFNYDEVNNAGIVLNVWLWPAVRFVYAPGYVVWVSPWRWRLYPAWWHPWKPLKWHVFHPLRVRYHRTCVVVHTHRVIHAHKVYTPFRTTSVTIRTRHSASVGHYRVTRTKTNVTGPKGKTTTIKKTTVTGPKGKVKASKTTVKRKRG